MSDPVLRANLVAMMKYLNTSYVSEFAHPKELPEGCDFPCGAEEKYHMEVSKENPEGTSRFSATPFTYREETPGFYIDCPLPVSVLKRMLYYPYLSCHSKMREQVIENLTTLALHGLGITYTPEKGRKLR